MSRGVALLLSILASALAYAQVPIVTSVSPESGPAGTEVTITGLNFISDLSSNKIYFGTVKAVVTQASPTQLKTKVPVGAGYKPISVLVNGLQGISPKPFVVTSVNESLITPASFSEKNSFDLSGSPYEISAADIDMDGKPDLVVAGFRTISILRNTSAQGSISSTSFTRSDIVTDGISIMSVAIGDIDGDGKPDVVGISAAGSANSITVFRNNSTPGFVSASSFIRTTFNSGSNPQKVIIADLDNDGKPDVITANGNNSISIHHNTSTKLGIAFENHVDVNTTTPGTAETVAAADMDLDGKQDLIEYNLSNNVYTISLMHNQAVVGDIRQSSFALAVPFGSGLISDSDIAIGDLDNDGRPDMLANFGSTNTISILKNLSSPGAFNSASFATKVDFGTGLNPFCGKVIAEINGDGFPDIISTNRESNTWSVLQNKGQAGVINTASFFPKVDFGTGDKPTGVTAADFDGDGMTDIAVVSRESKTAEVYRNQMADPGLVSFTPQVGAPGTQFTVSGVNFGTDTLGITVRISGTRARILSANSVTATAVVPKGAVTGPLTVTRQGPTRVYSVEFTVLPLAITSFSPPTVFAGERLTIKGTGFSLGKTNNVVRINDVEATVESAITGELNVIVPAGATTGKITVVANGIATTTTTKDVVVTPVSITNVSFPELFTIGGQEVSASVSYGNTQQVSRIKFMSRGITATTSLFHEDNIEVSPSGVASFTIPPGYFTDPIGLQMKFVITDAEGNEIVREGYAYKKFTESENFPGLSFGSDVENYQVISVPLELTNRFASNVFRQLGDFNPSKWRVFTFENQVPEELNRADAMMYPGFGYWFIAKEETEISPGEGTTVRANAGQPYVLKLKPGWNMIGNPYNFPLSWDDVLAFNGNPVSIGTLRQFEAGTFAIKNTLNRFRGAFVRNAGTSDAYIKIPVANTSGSSRKGSDDCCHSGDRPGKPGDDYAKNWDVILTVSDGKFSNALGGFGMNKDASEGADPLDEVALSLPGGMSSFELVMRSAKENIIKDIVPTNEAYTWTGTITSRDGVTLSWDNLPTQQLTNELWMELPGQPSLVDMRTANRVTIPAGEASFRIIYGTRQYVDRASGIDEILIGEVATNPLSRHSPVLSVPVNLAGESNSVQLSIIDAKGSPTGYSMLKDYHRGRNVIEWRNDFTRLSQGLYVLAITVGSEHSLQTFYRKFIVE